VTLHWVYTFGNAAAAASAQATGAGSTLGWSPAPTCDRTGIVVTGPLTIPIVVPAPPASAMTLEGNATFNVVATSDAPGETPITCTFTAFVDAFNQVVPKTSPATTAAPVTAAFLGLVSAQAGTTIAELAPGTPTNFTFRLTNLGNSLAAVHATVTSAPGWNATVAVPPPLGSKNQGGDPDGVLTVQVEAVPHEGWNMREQTFQVKLTPVSTKDANLTGNVVTVNLLARLRGLWCPAGATSAPCTSDRASFERCQADPAARCSLAEASQQASHASPTAAVALLGVTVLATGWVRRRAPRP